MTEHFLMIDFPALLIALLASVQCALLGSYLILREQAVMIDAISHSVLPGIVAGVVLSGSFGFIYVMSGSIAASLIAITLVHIIQRYGNISQGAAIGAVFTAMFALGVILLETQVGSRVHLDTQHVLYGALELSYWANPYDPRSLPPQVMTLSFTLLLTALFLFLYKKEILLTTFDPLFSRVTGFKPQIFHILLLLFTALVSVSCFEAMGSILVISLFVCPAAAARLFNDSMNGQLGWSVAFGVISTLVGYVLANILPGVFGLSYTFNTAACIAFTAGLILLLCTLIINNWQKA